MNKKLKAYLLMSPLIVLAIFGIITLLWGIITIASPCFTFGWTMKDTKQGLVIGGFLTAMVIIFRMFEKGCLLKEEAKCLCTKVCDCQDPEGKLNGSNGSVCLISNECPIHNDEPYPHPDCPIHN